MHSFLHVLGFLYGCILLYVYMNVHVFIFAFGFFGGWFVYVPRVFVGYTRNKRHIEQYCKLVRVLIQPI